ncbi:Qat anti-phage system QueC-like protein QatC [Shewanella marisflavi]|uniref:7-cyano-7-deazaguanine synthase n=1 Tax=Shewanella marisflavi TaxID=260364 RepID=A0AAC9XM94_9GAMM|nr:Qat anti-phage system QueC-like protein QatC [Shewanella marisflavi]ASJ95635.1 hypothetical protein CFF01_03005 [Shewanella marisflavi]
MKRCSVVGLIDSKDTVELSNPDSILLSLVLPNKHENTKYGVGAFVKRAKKVINDPNIHASELLNLAALIYAADTRISRKENSQDGWTREFDIYFPVNNVQEWEPIRRNIQDILSFLTGDLWRIFLRARPEEKPLEPLQCDREEKLQINAVSLLSGGLDSFIGAIDLLESKNNTIFMGHYTADGTQNYQNLIESALKNEYPDYFKEYIKGNVSFNKRVIDDQHKSIASENSQRSRSFLFLAMGAYLASGVGGVCKLVVPENGFIALNVPLDPLRIGANSTKTVHPNFMSKINDIFKYLELGIDLRNPYRHSTKGEMMSDCLNQKLLSEHAFKTLSCASQGKMRWDNGNKAKRLGGAGGNGNCGYCFPCLIRKAAFKKSAVADDTQYVAISDFAKAEIKSGKSGKGYAESRDILSVQFAGYKLNKGLINPAIEIHKSGSLSTVEDEWSTIADMYRRGLNEVYELVKDVPIKQTL